MDYDKKYRDLVEAVKELQEANPHDEGIQKWVEDNVPQLAKYRDEIARRGLLEWLKKKRNNTTIPFSIREADSWIAWLEKQGEHKHQYKSKPRYVGEGELLRTDKQGEKKPVEWSEEDETGWINTMIMIEECASNHYTKDSIKLVVDWLKSLKDRVVPQPKQEWSEEDEYNKRQVCRILREAGCSQNLQDKIDSWLESIKPQPHWKPSNEQIGALEHFVRSIAESGFASPYDSNTKLVYSLFNDLKKLREE